LCREEYLFVYSVYVLEVWTKKAAVTSLLIHIQASTSNRLTHFYPPLVNITPGKRNTFAILINFQNLIPLIFIRPLRLFIAAEKLRRTRIMLLKITHLPIVGTIWVFERAHEKIRGGASGFSSISHIGPGSTQLSQDSRIPSKKPKPFLSDRTNSKRTSQQFSEVPNEDGAHSLGPHSYKIRSKKDLDATIVVNNTDLENQVKDLSVKIAELTALIMAQQGNGGDE
jgi:hypothetical protein